MYFALITRAFLLSPRPVAALEPHGKVSESSYFASKIF
jgi:hypothetical protein